MSIYQVIQKHRYRSRQAEDDLWITRAASCVWKQLVTGTVGNRAMGSPGWDFRAELRGGQMHRSVSDTEGPSLVHRTGAQGTSR